MGHCPPYIAVITLSVMTAHHWRVIRTKLIQAGIADPMSLTSLHVVLDTTEAAILEGFAMSRAKDAEMKQSLFLDKLYSPTADQFGINDEDYDATPKGFASEDIEASFDAFAAAAH